MGHPGEPDLSPFRPRASGPLRDFAQRTKARGKPSKVALVSIAHKLLVIANAVIRDGRPREAMATTAA
jgi:hypothetical protein